MMTILTITGKAIAYFIVSMIASCIYTWLLAKACKEDGGYFLESDAPAWILVFIVLNNIALWLIDPISHISIAWI